MMFLKLQQDNLTKPNGPFKLSSLPYIFKVHAYLTILNKLLDFFVGLGLGLGITILYVNPIIHKMGGSFDIGKTLFHLILKFELFFKYPKSRTNTQN
jgi:hypothetical protein